MSVVAVVTAIAAIASTVRSVNASGNAASLRQAAINQQELATEDAAMEMWMVEQKIEAFKEFEIYQDEVERTNKIIMLSSIAVGIISSMIFVVQIRRK
tara:strand:- start:662 stop:955 length:294 start_codon:yes stop_codon:yes gene_type:complete